MTNFTKNTIVAAAALLVAAGMAGAQTIKAEVPFGFRVAGTPMPAGAYRVTASQPAGGSLIFILKNEDANRSVVTLPTTWDNLKSGESAASMTFECAGADCALVKVAPGTTQSFRMAKPRMGAEDTHLAVIRAVVVRAR